MFLRILLLVSFASSAALAEGRCEGLFGSRLEVRKELMDADLSDRFALETAGKSAEEIAVMNEKTLAELDAEIPDKIQSRRQKSSISIQTADFLRNQILENPIVNPSSSKYDQDSVSIGYCFGRATFVHLMLLKMGVQKESIQKIWAVGPMKAGGIMWQFHVATMAYVEGHGWVVVDSNHYKPMPVREWTTHYANQTENGKIRFYATEAGKFAYELGKYSRVQMGLDLSAEKDWYKHYFKDMLDWLKTKRVTENSVKPIGTKITKEESDLNESFADMWRSVVEFMR